MTAKCAAIATRKRISETIHVMNFGALVRLAIESKLHAASPRVQRSRFLCEGHREIRQLAAITSSSCKRRAAQNSRGGAVARRLEAGLISPLLRVSA